MFDQLQDGFHQKALDDGSVGFTFVKSGKPLVGGSLTPVQLSVVVSNMLNCAHNAFRNADKQPGPIKDSFEGGAIPVTRWYVGATREPSQPVVAIEVGQSAIAFRVDSWQLRGLARSLIAGSFHSSQSALSLTALFAETMRDLAIGLRGWGGVFSVRFQAWSRLRAMSFSSWISGRSLRIFRTIRIGQNCQVPKYDECHKCIYCGAATYSSRLGIRQHPLVPLHSDFDGLDSVSK
jgi:hypothetical protein